MNPITPFGTKKKRPQDKIRTGEFPRTSFIVLLVFSIAIILIGIRQIRDTLSFQTQKPPALNLDGMLQGILMLEDQPGLALSPEQARRIFPRLMPFQGYSDVFNRFETAVSAALDDSQKAFIAAKSGQPFNPAGKKQIPQGYERIQWIYSALSAYAAGAAAQPVNTHGSDTAWVKRLPGYEDVCEGLYRLYQSGKLEKSDAAYLLPFISDIADAYKVIETKGNSEVVFIDSVLNEKQREFIRNIDTPPAPDFSRKNLQIVIALLKEKQGGAH
ncbi:MAG: hypothetical protein LWY06_07790 [Firmicutes bacterium]|nr:hypothetical protein [Bacillota bacterium]